MTSKIECKICGKKFKKLTNSHLRLHDMRPEEYKERFPGTEKDFTNEDNPFHENHIPWNKGKEMSEETKEKIRDKTRERWSDPKERKKFSQTIKRGYENGREPWNKGLSAEEDERVKQYAEKQRGQKREGDYRSGEEHYRWKGGPLEQNELTGSWNELAEEIKERDGYECQCCGKRNCRLEVHHLFPRRVHQNYNHSKEELVTLCVPCHRIWEKHYYELLDSGDIPSPEEMVS